MKSSMLNILICSVFLCSCGTSGAERPFTIGPDIYSVPVKMEEFSFYSKTLNDHLKLDISYIEGTKSSTEKFAAVYVTDGHWRAVDHKYFHYLSYRKLTDKMIIIGIGYPQGYDYGSIRQRDLTDDPDRFKKALKEEIIPFVESEFPADSSKRILYGASYGGYFTFHSLVSDNGRQGLFQTYISACAVAKTYSARKLLESKLPTIENRNANLFFGVGTDDDNYIVDTNNNFNRILSSADSSGLKWKYNSYSGKDHYTVCRNVFIDGILEFYGHSKRDTRGINDLNYQSAAYDFKKPAELMDWGIMGSKEDSAVKKLTVITAPDGNTELRAVEADCIFTKDSPNAVIENTFDHFENLSGKTFSISIFAAQGAAGRYIIALRIKSTYNWVSDDSSYVQLKEGWQKLTFRIDSTSAKGSTDLVRSAGFVIKQSEAEYPDKRKFIFSNISWK